MIIDKINFNSDMWIIPNHNKSASKTVRIDFNKIKVLTLRYQVKQVLMEIIKRNALASSSIISYYSKLINYFFPFLEAHDIHISFFSDLTKEIIDTYTLHLLQRSDISNNTKILALISIKALVSYGNLYRLEKFPNEYIFEKSYCHIFGIDDVLETKAISPEHMDIINNNLNTIQHRYLREIIIIARDTGLRLSSILELQRNCLLEDFSGHPVLYCYSHKDDEEIYTVATSDVKECILRLEKNYVENDGEYLFVGEVTNTVYKQSLAREALKTFLKRIGLEHSGITFHSFRHTLGTEMLNNGATTEQVGTQLHHKSLHNTNIYARIHDKTVENEYRKMRVLGLESVDDIKNGSCTNHYGGSLPDGYCKQFIKDDGNVCESFNRCLLCSNFMTFKDDLPTHKEHLKRIQEDVYKYMQEEAIPNFEILSKVENSLINIISELENE